MVVGSVLVALLAASSLRVCPICSAFIAQEVLRPHCIRSRAACSHQASTQGPSLLYTKRSKNQVELGVQTAQLLLDKRHHDRLRDDIAEMYPLIPSPVLTTAIRLTASGFSTLAPNQLKLALSPGGMDKVRPEIRDTVVTTVLEQRAVRMFPLLNQSEKRDLLNAVVDLCMDQILNDAEWVLSKPEIRLEELEEQIEEIKKEMGLWRLIQYRVRRNLVEYTSVLLLASFCGLSYHQGSVMQAALTVKSSLVAVLFLLKGLVLRLQPMLQSWWQNLAKLFNSVL